VRILAMVPIYSVTSWFALVVQAPPTLLWLAFVRDFYEAYVIYNFMALLINYGGGDRQLAYFLDGQPRLHHTWPLSLWLPPTRLGPTFINLVRAATLQFVFVKPTCAFVKIKLYAAGHESGSFMLMLSIIENLSVSTALYGLVLFYHAAEEILRPYGPLPKFISVKAVVFLTFWQGVVLSIAVRLHLLTDIEGFSAHEQATGLQDILICFEMAVAALAHYHVFSYKEYKEYANSMALHSTFYRSEHPVLHRFADVVDFRDVLSDAQTRLSGGGFERELRDSEPLLPNADLVLSSNSPRALSARSSQGSISDIRYGLSPLAWDHNRDVLVEESPPSEVRLHERPAIVTKVLIGGNNLQEGSTS
jgi:Organic solute transporter Ostalpha